MLASFVTQGNAYDGILSKINQDSKQYIGMSSIYTQYMPKEKIIRHNVVKMAILLKLTYRVNAISTKIPADVSAEIDGLILHFTWKCKGPRIGKTILKK